MALLLVGYSDVSGMVGGTNVTECVCYLRLNVPEFFLMASKALNS